MFFKLKIIIFLFFLQISFFSENTYSQNKNDKKKVLKLLESWKSPFPNWAYLGIIKIDSVSISSKTKKIKIHFSKPLTYLPIRENDVDLINQTISNCLKKDFKEYLIETYSDGHQVSELVPNWLRKKIPVDKNRLHSKEKERVPIIRKADGLHPLAGLYNKNIAIWQSHGYYYEPPNDRWKWQRPRLFGTVEDISTMAHVIPYLAPMIENAGGYVFIPRERDFQTNEIIVDNDISSQNSEFIISKDLKYETVASGFKYKDTLYGNENPFRLGTSLRFKTSKSGAKITYLPSFASSGKYAVYISYIQSHENCQEVKYTIKHSGGETSYLINQKSAGNIWIYLGTFEFEAGKNIEKGAVIIQTSGKEKGWITVDAVKFGGGMGNIARKPISESSQNGKQSVFKWKLSNKPRYAEGARYFLQYSGFPDTLVWNLNEGKNDYKDDYQCRGQWVNYLAGILKVDKIKNKYFGLNIPIDLSLAFHTDAGITPNDSVIGTLAIYTTTNEKGVFPNKQSRMASRDLSDFLQTQIIHDVRYHFNPKWTRRGLWDKEYSETYRPSVPSMILELFSHQNLADVKFGLDPQFRFTVSRAIYKGILKYLAFQDNRKYVVQPLPVEQFSIHFISRKTIKLNWKPVSDILEPTAKPTAYKVYKRINSSGFDNGTIVNDTTFTINLDKFNTIYSFKITALNDGGESFPSEILAVGLKNEKAEKVLVVNGFYRVAGPAMIDKNNFSGIAWWNDQGVPDKFEMCYTGFQNNFNRKEVWTDDDNPGWGASYADFEGKIFIGNTFDFTSVHGEAIMAAGFSFVSISKKEFCSKNFNYSSYKMFDIILGEEKSTPNFKDNSLFDFQIFTPQFQQRLTEILNTGSSVFLSGAYVGTDLSNVKDSSAIKFAKNILHFSWRAGYAVNEGKIYTTDNSSKWFNGKWNFNTSYNPTIYTVEAPDVIEPEGKNALSAFRYAENNFSAGVIYNGKYKTVILGFPFETVLEKQKRDALMKQILMFFKRE